MSGIATAEGFAPFSTAGALAAGTAAFPFLVAPFDLEIANVVAYVGTAPAGGPTLLNVSILRADGSGTVNAYSGTATQPQIAAGALRSYTEQTQTFPAGSWPKAAPYALNDPQPGGALATAPAYTAQSVLPIAAPDLNSIAYAGDALFLVVAVGTGNTALGSNLGGSLHWLKR